MLSRNLYCKQNCSTNLLDQYHFLNKYESYHFSILKSTGLMRDGIVHNYDMYKIFPIIGCRTLVLFEIKSTIITVATQRQWPLDIQPFNLVHSFILPKYDPFSIHLLDKLRFWWVFFSFLVDRAHPPLTK